MSEYWYFILRLIYGINIIALHKWLADGSCRIVILLYISKLCTETTQRLKNLSLCQYEDNFRY